MLKFSFVDRLFYWFIGLLFEDFGFIRRWWWFEVMEKVKYVYRVVKGNLIRTFNVGNMLLEVKKILNMSSKRDVALEILS